MRHEKNASKWVQADQNFNECSSTIPAQLLAVRIPAQVFRIRQQERGFLLRLEFEFPAMAAKLEQAAPQRRRILAQRTEQAALQHEQPSNGNKKQRKISKFRKLWKI